jgi:4'-phosphopantetheinyl transferase
MTVWVSKFPVSEPTRVLPDEITFSEMRDALRRVGFALAYGRVDDWDPGPLEPPALERLLGTEAERYRKIAHPRVHRCFIASRVLLRHVAGIAVGAEPEQFEIARHPNGRPYLRGIDGVEVSISHTGQIVVAGVSRLGAIGVDVEAVARRIHVPEMAERVCSPYEQELLRDLPHAERQDYLIRLWTLKESYSKALGLGLRLSFCTFGFELMPDTAAARLVQFDGQKVEGEEWSFEVHNLEGRYAVGMAVSQGAFGGTRDTEASTMLDSNLLAAVLADSALAAESGQM